MSPPSVCSWRQHSQIAAKALSCGATDVMQYSWSQIAGPAYTMPPARAQLMLPKNSLGGGQLYKYALPHAL